MSYRFRANLLFTSDGKHLGYAQWCDDQAAQRMSMAFHMNEGALNEEPSFHEVREDGWRWACDMFVLDGDKAILEDLYAHIESIWWSVESKGEGEEKEHSRMDMHYCRHKEGGACDQPYMVKQTD